ncbi:MAG: neutral zinc metallopeptidase [Leptospiraceae bacterium]|nr:neutral zinc metallopeptidase [Leptospiraceae bacterium]
MREDGRESDNIEDRRGSSGGNSGGLGLGLIFSLLSSKSGIAVLVIGFIVSYFLGISPMKIISLLSGGNEPISTNQNNTINKKPIEESNKEKDNRKRVSVVLADNEDVWKNEFQNIDRVYEEPKLVLFRDSTPTACGSGKSAMGPFYCPADRKIYIDLGFFEEMETRFQAPGEFAQAYVIAHEVGHHVQNLLGISRKVRKAQKSKSEEESNALSVKLELQADCYAGVWGNHAEKARKILENGDIESALNAATQIGDDTLQKRSGREIVPETFTHGSSAQRVKWFKKGFESGNVKDCNTFLSE